MTTHYHYQLRWMFTNDHEWVKIFDSEEEANTHALIYGLYTHPSIKKVEIKACPYSRKKGELKAEVFENLNLS